MKTNLLTILLSIFIFTSCSPINEYLNQDDFSKNMRAIQSSNSEGYEAQDFENLTAIMQTASRHNRNLEMEQYTYKQSLDLMRELREEYEADLTTYQAASVAFREKSYDIGIVVDKVLLGYGDTDPIDFTMRIKNRTGESIKSLDYRIVIEQNERVIGKRSFAHSTSELLPDKSITFITTAQPQDFNPTRRIDKGNLYTAKIEAINFTSGLTLTEPVKPENPFSENNFATTR